MDEMPAKFSDEQHLLPIFRLFGRTNAYVYREGLVCLHIKISISLLGVQLNIQLSLPKQVCSKNYFIEKKDDCKKKEK